MSRRMKLPTNEMGFLHVEAVSKRGGEWEAEWAPLRDTVVGAQFSGCTREVLDHALHGFSRPLVDSLGIPPSGALLKVILKTGRECATRKPCPIYLERDCLLDSPKMPWCFAAENLPDGVREIAARAFGLWKEGVYLVVVKEP